MADTDPSPQSLADTQPIIDELVGTIATRDVKQRLRILQRVTDLFITSSRGYSDHQIALFDDVLQRLSADIEVKARARLANQMADFKNAPPLAKAAGCSWTTARELLTMSAANRGLSSDDLAQVFERYKKLEWQTARNVARFFMQRLELRKRAKEASVVLPDGGAKTSGKKRSAERASRAGGRGRVAQPA